MKCFRGAQVAQMVFTVSVSGLLMTSAIAQQVHQVRPPQQVPPAEQVQTLDRAPRGEIHPAGCDCAAHGVASDYMIHNDMGFVSDSCGPSCGGTVWGTQCMSSCCGNKVGLFPPCPNPCGGTYIGDRLAKAKGKLDSGLKGMFGKLLGRKNCCDACGYVDCDGACGHPYDGGTDIPCECSDCQSAVQPLPAPPMDTAEPTPSSTPSQTDPFVDDSAAMGSGARFRGPTNRVRQTSYRVSPNSRSGKSLRRAHGNQIKGLRPSHATKHSRPSKQSYHNSSQPRVQHYRHRSPSGMRPIGSGPAPEANTQHVNNDDDADLRFVD